MLHIYSDSEIKLFALIICLFETKAHGSITRAWNSCLFSAISTLSFDFFPTLPGIKPIVFRANTGDLVADVEYRVFVSRELKTIPLHGLKEYLYTINGVDQSHNTKDEQSVLHFLFYN